MSRGRVGASPPDRSRSTSSVAGPPGRGRRHVIFALAGVTYAVDAAVVRRALPVPDPPAAEVVSVGQGFPLVDLRTLFRLPASTDRGRLVLLVQTASGRAGLIVDDLVQLAVVEDTAIAPLPAPFRGAERRWFAGLARLGSRVVVVLSPDTILAAGAVLPPILPAEASSAG